jgi:DNA polymerase-3 subunit delta'
MNATDAGQLPAWLNRQLVDLMHHPAHALLLRGPSGLGQYELGLALASAWLCLEPGPAGACGRCSSCHGIAVRTHADLCVLMPESLSLQHGWPMDEKLQAELEGGKRKPSTEIKVDAARDAVSFTQLSRSGGTTKVVLVYPAERMNAITANTLLKTLEEPTGAVRFILASEAADRLLPTLRSRCQIHTLAWPDEAEALGWLTEQATRGQADGRVDPEHLRVLLAASGGRPADALAMMEQGGAKGAAEGWRALPQALARGQVSALSDLSPARAISTLQKVCHDLWCVRLGAAPRYFQAADLPARSASTPGSLYLLGAWSRELAALARHAEHPFNAGLLFEALVSRAQQVLRKA